ncbi:MAG: nucleotidyltransferase family protein [Burkholderiales bacterium]|nr:nucleotidyltransferase family protein [Burkholderiales bacterium]
MPGGHFSAPADARTRSAPAGRGVVVVLLAAGLARRFGGDKLSAELPDGRPVGAASLAAACAAWPDVICVVRPGTAMAQMAREAGVVAVECPEAVDGMGLSLAAGVRASAGAAGWVIALADMPFVSPATVRAVAAAVAGGAGIVAPVYAGERGHPVGFHSDLGQTLAGLRGDEGARTVVGANRHRLELLPVDDPGILRDIDQPSDLAAKGPD